MANRMATPVSIDSLVAQVRDQFRIFNSAPNGWAIKWDESRYFEAITAAAKPYPTVNYTDFNYEFCNSYAVFFDQLPTKCYRALMIEVSFVAPVFCFYWTQAECDLRKKNWPNAYPSAREKATERVRALLVRENLFEVPDDWLNTKIEGVELELSGSTDVTLYKCLFVDSFSKSG